MSFKELSTKFPLISWGLDLILPGFSRHSCQLGYSEGTLRDKFCSHGALNYSERWQSSRKSLCLDVFKALKIKTRPFKLVSLVMGRQKSKLKHPVKEQFCIGEKAAHVSHVSDFTQIN